MNLVYRKLVILASAFLLCMFRYSFVHIQQRGPLVHKVSFLSDTVHVICKTPFCDYSSHCAECCFTVVEGINHCPPRKDVEES